MVSGFQMLAVAGLSQDMGVEPTTIDLLFCSILSSQSREENRTAKSDAFPGLLNFKWIKPRGKCHERERD